MNAALCLREEVCRYLDTPQADPAQARLVAGEIRPAPEPQAALTAFAAPQLPAAGRLDLRAPVRLYEAASFESEEIEKCGNYRTERETWLALSSAGLRAPSNISSDESRSLPNV